MRDSILYDFMSLASRAVEALERLAAAAEAQNEADPVALISKALVEEGLKPGADGLYIHPDDRETLVRSAAPAGDDLADVPESERWRFAPTARERQARTMAEDSSTQETR